MNMAEKKNLMGGDLREREPMARHVSWRAGGRVERAYTPADLDDLRAFLVSIPAHEPVWLVGLGSNLLVRDGGLRGTVIFTHGVLKEIGFDGDAIYAGAGVPSPKLARFASMRGLAGAEFIAGIPGTVGGALAINAGRHGGQAWDILASVTTLERAGQPRRRKHAHHTLR